MSPTHHPPPPPTWLTPSYLFRLFKIIYNELVNQFQEDGRLKLVTQQPDCVVEGTILKLEEDVYSYDSWNKAMIAIKLLAWHKVSAALMVLVQFWIFPEQMSIIWEENTFTNR